MKLAVTDEVTAPHALEFLSQQGPVFWVVVAQESLVQPALLELVHDRDGITVSADSFQRVVAAVIHGRCGGHGGWIKGLYLISPKLVAL